MFTPAHQQRAVNTLLPFSPFQPDWYWRFPLECRLRILLFHQIDIISNLIRKSNCLSIACIRSARQHVWWCLTHTVCSSLFSDLHSLCSSHQRFILPILVAKNASRDWNLLSDVFYTCLSFLLENLLRSSCSHTKVDFGLGRPAWAAQYD